MSVALRIANAVCEAQLRAKAQLIALGTPEDMIGYWTPRGSSQCGITVAGVLACEVFVHDAEIKRTFEQNAKSPVLGFLYRSLLEDVTEVNAETIIVRVYWCGGEPNEVVGPERWVPDAHVIEYWQREERGS